MARTVITPKSARRYFKMPIAPLYRSSTGASIPGAIVLVVLRSTSIGLLSFLSCAWRSRVSRSREARCAGRLAESARRQSIGTEVDARRICAAIANRIVCNRVSEYTQCIS
ncbi:hypothetical protein SCHPADRAFT_678787 [Schizopora paradoxa]|uniref:Uncharacterized protein n=1 Tax=Schizopora paradoxa TaxID=27342 RepID=A0A0H2RB93_9AGAM|nr:hypothetical protein SCHPADRAFT_678787 [Schizopora paradoxa]